MTKKECKIIISDIFFECKLLLFSRQYDKIRENASLQSFIDYIKKDMEMLNYEVLTLENFGYICKKVGKKINMKLQ